MRAKIMRVLCKVHFFPKVIKKKYARHARPSSHLSEAMDNTRDLSELTAKNDPRAEEAKKKTSHHAMPGSATVSNDVLRTLDGVGGAFEGGSK